MTIAKHIPNALTSCNLLCGCASIVLAAEGNFHWSAYLIFIALIFDFGDGLAARALKVQSELGKQLDSLADMVTFGVAPGILIYYYAYSDIPFYNSIGNYSSLYGELVSLGPSAHAEIQSWLVYLAFLIPVFSAIRLAKFNLDETQSREFKGLATPACALFFAGIVACTPSTTSHIYADPASSFWDCGEYTTTSNQRTVLNEDDPEQLRSLQAYLNREQYGTWPLLDSSNGRSGPKHVFPRMYRDSINELPDSLPSGNWLNEMEFVDRIDDGIHIEHHPSFRDYLLFMDRNYKFYALIFCFIGFSLLLVAPIRMFSFKFKSMGWKGNEIRYIFIAITLLSILGALLIKNIALAAPIIILLYIVISMINNLFRKKNEIQS
ncbi:MAG: CDP-alcohol phosphatidyltransferase family protein [Flavobacteriales bacterium]|nr:CDP-alcohol phosphatidyltransferase family protein [Flavobacteriales bacterium]